MLLKPPPIARPTKSADSALKVFAIHIVTEKNVMELNGFVDK